MRDSQPVGVVKGTRTPGLRLQCSAPPWPPIGTQRFAYCQSLLLLLLELESELESQLESQLELELVVDLDVEVHAMEGT